MELFLRKEPAVLEDHVIHTFFPHSAEAPPEPLPSATIDNAKEELDTPFTLSELVAALAQATACWWPGTSPRSVGVLWLADVRKMSSQPTQQAYAFDVVVPEGAGPKDVVDATASIVTLEEVYCVQHFGGRNYQVTVKSEAAKAKIVDADSLVIGEERVSIVILSPQVTQVTVLFLPCRVSSDTLAQALAPYGKVINISRCLIGSRPTVTTGTRYVRIEMKPGSPVPT
ncbi:hypothetical protein HPB49_016103 [Dermacentor silvarum]|uniref:Uncharacterized protein n=1 Tax=Dermacentor silvarum TaxID=543639 RepID=A0ACB8CG99_DERSI|nr:hypothetical protein HPB49_016103 [Dermacentor silvarum]